MHQCYPPSSDMTDEQARKFHKDLGERLRLMRTEVDYTQSEIADHLGVSQQVYASYEVGRLRLPVMHLSNLAKLYQVSVEELLGLQSGKGKPGPTGKLKKAFDQAAALPKRRQQRVIEMVDDMVAAQEAQAS